MACSRYGWNLGQGGSRQNYCWVWPSRSWETGHSGFLKHQGQASLKAGLFNIQELRLKSISANYITYTWIIWRFKEKVYLLSALAPLPLLAVRMLSRVRLSVTPWIVAWQAPLSTGLSRQEYWSGLAFPSPGDLPDPETEPTSFVSPALAGQILYHSTTWEAIHPVYFLCLWVVQGYGAVFKH